MKARINGIDLAFGVAGSGPAVILIHGFPLCRRMWHPQIGPLTDAGFRVVTLDLRGFGESEAPDGPYSMEVFADDVVALMDHLGLEQAIIGGMSMGGYVLLNMLERHFRRVSAACFIVTRAAADDETAQANRTRLAHGAREAGPRIVAEAFEKILFAEQTPLRRPDLVAEVRHWMMGTDPRGLAGGLLAMRDRKDYTAELGRLDLSALVVGAEQDRAIAAEHTAVFEQHLPRATVCRIPGGGHLANLETPSRFNDCLIDFLHGLSSAPASEK
jgi:3-oxoadipate enol-lactonase